MSEAIKGDTQVDKDAKRELNSVDGMFTPKTFNNLDRPVLRRCVLVFGMAFVRALYYLSIRTDQHTTLPEGRKIRRGNHA